MVPNNKKLFVQYPCRRDSVITILLSNQYLLSKVLITHFLVDVSRQTNLYLDYLADFYYLQNHYELWIYDLSRCEQYTIDFDELLLAFCTVWLVFLVFCFIRQFIFWNVHANLSRVKYHESIEKFKNKNIQFNIVYFKAFG